MWMQAQEHLLRQPWWLDWTAGLFPVLFVVFVLRSFLFEPFKIPSGSMIPTLLVGDLDFGEQIHLRRAPAGDQQKNHRRPGGRSAAMSIVFPLPAQPSLDYIKRVVGLPGDKVEYLNKRLRINGQEVPHRGPARLFRYRCHALFPAV